MARQLEREGEQYTSETPYNSATNQLYIFNRNLAASCYVLNPDTLAWSSFSIAGLGVPSGVTYMASTNRLYWIDNSGNRIWETTTAGAIISKDLEVPACFPAGLKPVVGHSVPQWV